MKRGCMLDYQITPDNLKELVVRLLNDTEGIFEPGARVTESEDYAMTVLCWIDELMTRVEE